jgi:hypothetical protein
MARKFKKQELKVVAQMLFTEDSKYTAFTPMSYKEAKKLKPGDVVGILATGSSSLFLEAVSSINVSKGHHVEVDTDSADGVVLVYKEPKFHSTCEVYKHLVPVKYTSI